MEQLLFTMENEMENLNLTTETLEEGLDDISFAEEGEDEEATKILEEMQASRVATTASSLASGSDSLSDDIEERLKKLKGEGGDN